MNTCEDDGSRFTAAFEKSGRQYPGIRTPAAQCVPILLADDDEDDRFLTTDALKSSKLVNSIRTVKDGEELMDYLLRRGAYAAPASAPRPGIILLDLNMPRKDGREALQEIKAHPALRSIPVIVLTTSETEEDIVRSYNLGVNSFISKPVTFEGLVAALKVATEYWFQIVRLPARTVDLEMSEYA
jgi:CheY-like chemotaxis protein